MTHDPTTRWAHHRRGPAEGPRREHGYTMMMTALLLVPMMFMAALAVDVGSWYTRGQEIQRAADAAALAGVVWLPDYLDKAQEAAKAVAAKNGLADGVGGVTVTASQVPGNRRQLKVTIVDPKVPTYFGAMAKKQIGISRSAIAEYVLAVPLGSPTNMIGTGDLQTTNPENFWLATSGYCASRENGDLRLTESSGNYASTSTKSVVVGGSTRYYKNFSCIGTEDNTEYDPDGYVYAVEVAAAGTYTIEAYDASFDSSTYSSSLRRMVSSSEAGDSAMVNTYAASNLGGTPLDVARISTTFTLLGADATANDWKDNPQLSTVTVGTDSAAYKNLWTSVGSFTAPKAGTYYVQVYTDDYAGTNDTSWGSNSFALRVKSGGSSALCTTLTGQPGYSATCPQIHGLTDMSILANLAGTQAAFYLANVDAVHAGKTFEIDLFDPGEGAKALEILNPQGSPVTFNWSTPCSPPTAPTGGCSGSSNKLDLIGNVDGGGDPDNPQPGPNRVSGSKYSDRTLTITIPLSTTYTGGWWKVRYTVGSAPTDRTTWSARILGDPIHLIG